MVLRGLWLRVEGFRDEELVGSRTMIDSGLVGPLWERYYESRRCSRDTFQESCITKYTGIKRLVLRGENGGDRLREGYHESRRCSRGTYPESYITK